MQKDFHFYVTYALARKAGISAQTAKVIAWADQYVDDLTEADLYGLQTQCAKLGNWGDRQIQISVLIPFHFIPGGTPESDWPWKTTENNERAQRLVEAATARNSPLSLGIALHGLQDTFSHQGFSGWSEDKNSCYPWYYLKSALPNVGHTEMMALPDMVDQTWNDPRNNRRIDNRRRALRAAHETFSALARVSGREDQAQVWRGLRPELMSVFRHHSYDERKEKLLALSENPHPRYNEITKAMAMTHRTNFVQAAAQHLAEAIELCADLSGSARAPGRSREGST